MESGAFWANNVNITNAKATYTGSGNQIAVYLGTSSTWDGTYTWEGPVTNETTFTLVANTNKFIKWKAIGLSYTMTNLNVEVNL